MKEGGEVKNEDRLDKEKLRRRNKNRDMPMNNKDWLELMGVNRDTYKRSKGGAIKNNRK